MRLIRCSKCGAVVATEDTLVENLMTRVEYLERRALIDTRNRPVFQQECKAITSIIKGILHMTAQMDEHSRLLIFEKKYLVQYVLDNNLVSGEKLHEIELAARAEVERRNRQDQKELDRLYGEANSILGGDKKRPTEKEALK